MFGNESEREKSEFNYAVKYLERLNYLFYRIDIAAMELDAHNWFHTLLTLFRELSTHMKDKEIEEFNKLKESLNSKLKLAADKRVREGVFEISSELYEELHNFEMKLRKIMKQSGLEGRMIDDATKALK